MSKIASVSMQTDIAVVAVDRDHGVLRLIEDSTVPVVLALHGTVIGGGVATALLEQLARAGSSFAQWQAQRTN